MEERLHWLSASPPPSGLNRGLNQNKNMFLFTRCTHTVYLQDESSHSAPSIQLLTNSDTKDMLNIEVILGVPFPISSSPLLLRRYLQFSFVCVCVTHHDSL